MRKVVATMGPAVDDVEVLKAVLPKIAYARLNMSHGTHHSHEEILGKIRSIDTEVEILVDLQGPKIRLGKFPGGPVVFQKGERTDLYYNPHKINECDRDHLYVSIEELTKEVQVDDILLFNDGYLSAKVVYKHTDEHLTIEILNKGKLSNNKGINSSTASLSANPLTPKDIEDLAFGVKINADIVALSFVRDAMDVRDLRRRLDELDSSAKICVKIERHEALDNLEEIIREADIVMIARGDLAVEIDQIELPYWQHQIIVESKKQNKPIVWATQVLESMIDHPRPTRAELTDVYTAIVSGSTYTMLSAESSVGDFATEAIDLMDAMWKRYSK